MVTYDVQNINKVNGINKSFVIQMKYHVVDVDEMHCNCVINLQLSCDCSTNFDEFDLSARHL